MTKPYQRVRLKIQGMDICLDMGNAVNGNLSRRLVKQKAPYDRKHVDAFSQIGCIFQVLEPSVFVVGRTFDPLQPRTGRCFAKLWLLKENDDGNSQNRTDNKDV